jgi:hypothetical protein
VPLDLDAVLVCLDTLAVVALQCGRATLSSTAVLDILTIPVQRFDGEAALDVHDVALVCMGP